jgi:carbon starvation protein
LATRIYGGYLERAWGVDGDKVTPAVSLRDNIDWVPAPKIVLFGHHFASIAGAAPVVGAITAAMWFGWGPVMIWCIFGSIFIGGVQDFGAMFASVRHGAQSIATVLQAYTGIAGKRIFSVFAFFTAILLTGAFIDIVATTFVATPPAATSALIYMLLAVIYGYLTNKMGVSTLVASVIIVPLCFLGIWAGIVFPIELAKESWMVILVIYIAIASVTPVWALLQPRDYLSSYLLAGVMVATIVGIIAYQPGFHMPAFKGFSSPGGPLFPVLFVAFACGACSGIHALIGSGTTSKQLSNERHMKFIAYFGMMLEGFLALLALTTVVFLVPEIRPEIEAKGALYIFSYGLGTFVEPFGVSPQMGITFGSLALSAFALTTMDTTLRLGRYVIQEFAAGDKSVQEAKAAGNVLCNNYLATVIALAVAVGIAYMGYLKIWTLFGTSNQLFSSMTLMGIILWLRKSGKVHSMCFLPMVWMMLVGIVSAVHLVFTRGILAETVNWPITLIAFLLLVAVLFLIWKMLLFVRSPDLQQKGMAESKA